MTLMSLLSGTNAGRPSCSPICQCFDELSVWRVKKTSGGARVPSSEETILSLSAFSSNENNNCRCEDVCSFLGRGINFFLLGLIVMMLEPIIACGFLNLLTSGIKGASYHLRYSGLRDLFSKCQPSFLGRAVAVGSRLVINRGVPGSLIR